jgi:hypothetical protein
MGGMEFSSTIAARYPCISLASQFNMAKTTYGLEKNAMLTRDFIKA